jgi:hypothetical protein
MGGFAFGRGFLFDLGACCRAPEGAMFVIGAKLHLAALLSAYAAGGSFLVLARKEPKKPLLGLGGLRCGKCRCPYVRTLTELPSDGLAPYVRTVGAGGWQPEFGEASQHRALRCRVWQDIACPDAQSAEVDEGTRRTYIAGCSGLTQASASSKGVGRRGRRPLR